MPLTPRVHEHQHRGPGTRPESQGERERKGCDERRTIHSHDRHRCPATTAPSQGRTAAERPERLMSYRQPRRGPRSSASPGDERWRTPRHTRSRGVPPLCPVKGRRPRTTPVAHRADDEVRRVLPRSHHPHPDPADDPNPQVLAVEARSSVLTSRSATRDVSCRHLQSTFQRRAPRLRSITAMARRGQLLFTRGRALRPTRYRSGAAVRRPPTGTCRDSGAPVTLGGRVLPVTAESPRPLSLEAREGPQVPRSEAPSLTERLFASPRPPALRTRR